MIKITKDLYGVMTGQKKLELVKMADNTLISFDEKTYKKKSVIYAIQIHEDFEVETLEGIMKGKAGDFLAQGVKGELYPIDKDIMKESYEEVK